MVQQGIELADKPHVVIATPGRLADHIETGTNFSLKRIRFLVCTDLFKRPTQMSIEFTAFIPFISLFTVVLNRHDLFGRLNCRYWMRPIDYLKITLENNCKQFSVLCLLNGKHCYLVQQ